MNESSLIKTLQETIESQNKTIEGLREELKRANENMEYLIKKLYGRKTEKTAAIDGRYDHRRYISLGNLQDLLA